MCQRARLPPRLSFRSMSRTTPAHTAYDWRTITALNTVSTLAQIGQFGIIFVMVPVWLALQGLSAVQLGFLRLRCGWGKCQASGWRLGCAAIGVLAP